MTRAEFDAVNRLPISASQGARSSSFSGVPEAIFSMFDCGCSESPSRNSAPSRSATAAPTVLLPQPATPITTMCGWPPRAAKPESPVMYRAVHEPVVRQVWLLGRVGGCCFLVELDADAGLVPGVQVAVLEGHGLLEDFVGLVRVL